MNLSIRRFLFGNLLLVLLCSFSSVPITPVPTKSKVENNRQKRLHKRYNRLHKRFDQAKTSKKRLHIQKKIRQVERQKDKTATPTMGLVGLGLAVLAFFLFFPAALYYIPVLAGLSAATALAGLITSCTAVVMCRKFPDRHSMKGFGVAGIILSSVLLVFSILFLLDYS